jgi:hypothetical protein
MIVEKPLTRIFPELHEDTDEFSINSQYSGGGGGGMAFKPLMSLGGSGSIENKTQYKVKKTNEKKNTKTKTSIIQEHFGLS